MSRNESVNVDDVVHLHSTADAHKFEHSNGTEFWVPKALGDWDGETLTLPYWKAEELGLI